MNNITLDRLRHRIDKVDLKILRLLAERMIISKKIGQIKSVLKLPPLQPARWKKVLQTRIKIGEDFGLRSNFIQMIWDHIHDESLTEQKRKTYDS